ncbi:hypothetical protein EU803_00630 [Loktanella sp. IMCC34160]|uniref:M10 family metallopeptidase C-terminal domain-containing protein n=1 Tax=Loktanella sp. IMCC34160 TaxID=2510646 RepID=UPI00101B87AA|nr:M10 family metallopeptidase C-terminal domain-containing protein [Loktanella sp. IMCC34160]RYG92644.1 hypothetical protein EU803_00630 [Loktanella sp. IMCC34160]
MASTISSDGTPTNGADPWIDSLVWGGQWTDAGGIVTITYSIETGTAPAAVFSGSGADWHSYEIVALEAAYAAWEAVANIEFVEVLNNANIENWLGSDAQVGALGWHNIPINNAIMPLYGVFSYQGTGWTSTGLLEGGYGFVTLIHEIGHGLGLAHPHDGGSAGDATNFPGVTSAFGDYGDYNLNQGIWTTMSYNDGWPAEITSGDYTYGWQATPMALDIAAIQAIYGANTTYASGSDTYVLPDANGSGTFWSCIWDTAGIDTISHAGGTNAAVINLNDAPLAADPANAGGFVSYADGIVGGFTIANGVMIENAIGGNGNDHITGNEGDNSISGGMGDDRALGGFGDDAVLGEVGNDRLSGGSGDDLIYAGDGNDHISGGSGNDVLDGGSGDDWILGGDGDDALYGGSGSDVFVFLDMTASTQDVIHDFEDGVDLIQMSLNAYLGQSAEAGDILIQQDGTDTVVTCGNSTIILLNIASSVIDGDDFLI